jgi:hypothetical protein
MNARFFFQLTVSELELCWLLAGGTYTVTKEGFTKYTTWK